MEVVNYPQYLIYEDGKVFSKISNKYLTPKNKRYLRVSLYNGEICKRVCIHQLVAEHYLHNSNPEILTEVDHIDRNTLNNHYTNLRWVSKSMNNLNRGLLKNNKLKEKNITFRNNCNKPYRFNKMIEGKRQEKLFYTLEDAKNYRDNINKKIIYT
tara:strand:+ start:78 stop:542 length:465 start_codon:yes stop_codon:yes gene_type:complete